MTLCKLLSRVAWRSFRTDREYHTVGANCPDEDNFSSNRASEVINLDLISGAKTLYLRA